MEARIGELLQHEICNISSRDVAAAGRQRIGQHAIGSGGWPVGEPWGPNDGVIEIAGGEKPLLCPLICHGIPQQRETRHTGEKIEDRRLVFACRIERACCSDGDDAVDAVKMHAIDDEGNCAAEDVLLFECAWAKRTEDGAVPVDGIAYRLRVKDISCDHLQPIAGVNCASGAHKSRDGMTEFERAGDEQPTDTPSSTKNNDLHEVFKIGQGHYTVLLLIRREATHKTNC